ncbi:MAG TPA: ferredoxin [Acidimicrobiales bacterium]|nr:ferredoxin [Acidimicrobiales bacterium]
MSERSLRLVVNGAQCDGHGICALIIPERISLDQWGYASLDDRPLDEGSTLARARRAVNACPARALLLK